MKRNIPLLRFKDKDGKDFPAWQEKKLGEIADIAYGKRITKDNNLGTKYPVYGGGNLSFMTDNYNLQDSIVISRFGVSKNCVRYIKGKFWLLDSGFTLKNKNKNILIKDFLNLLCLYIENEIYKTSRGLAQKNVNIKSVLSIQIPLPCIEEQSKIASFLSSIDKKIEILEKTYNEFSNFKKFAMQNLFPKV